MLSSSGGRASIPLGSSRRYGQSRPCTEADPTMNGDAYPKELIPEPFVAAVLDADADRCSNQIVHLAILTLLIETGLVSEAQVLDRLSALTSHLAHEHL